jgi:hypothetical protein
MASCLLDGSAFFQIHPDISFDPTESVVLLNYRRLLLIKTTWRSSSIDRLGPLAFRVILVMWRTNACLTQRSIHLLIG